MDHIVSPQSETSDEFYSKLTKAATHAIEDSLRQLRQSRIQGECPSNTPLSSLCKELMRFYPKGSSFSRPSFTLEFVDVTLDISKKEIVQILPYLLISYMFNYQNNETMHPKIPYNQPDFKLEEQKYPYSLDRFMMYDDTHPWSYTDDGFSRDHRNYKRAIARQARQFTLEPYTKVQTDRLAALSAHVNHLNDSGSVSEYAEIFWQIHIIANVFVLCLDEPTLCRKILYEHSMQLILKYFPFHQFKMANALWDYAQHCAGPTPLYAPLMFSTCYLSAISPQLISDYDLSKAPLSSFAERLNDVMENGIRDDAADGRWQMADGRKNKSKSDLAYDDTFRKRFFTSFY